MEFYISGHIIKITIDTLIAISAFLVSIVALVVSIFFWRRSFRPLVTAMVRTNSSGNMATLFDLELLNSGSLPAKDVRLIVLDENIEAALGTDSGEENRRRWLSCFDPEKTIAVLHNAEKIRCSFGLSRHDDAGFWRYGVNIPITIEYKGWFGRQYRTEQVIQIIDSESFTDFMWE